MAGKIGNQARRTRRLVQNLLSFAQQSPGEKKPVKHQRASLPMQSNARTGLDEPQDRIDVDLEEPCPGYGAIQIFCCKCSFLMNNAVDALSEIGGGKVTVRTPIAIKTT